MKKLLLILALVVFLSANLMAQTNETPAANPKDVESVDAIMKAVYDVISGDAGQKRNWDRFRSLFYPGARLIPTGKNPQTGVVGARVLSPDDYVKRVEPVFDKDGFHEREMARRIETYGNIVHAFSTYEAFRKLDEKKPFLRGINSFQLLNDGKRWWIMTIFWEAETPENPLPKKYLKSKKN